MKQLIDLNGDSTNFDITFKVQSTNGEPFDIVVADQTTLDNSAELEYRTASNGTMSGNLVQDKNVYQNYYLVLKSEQPCQVNVEITKQEVESKQQFVPQTPQEPTQSKGGVNWKLWLIIIVVVGGGIALYFIYRSDKKKKDVLPSPSPVSAAIQASPAPPSPVHSSPAPANDLLQRLKTLHMN